ncbi:hypothetical protein PZ739_07055 [Pseudomonas kermanshahensis]|jgi:hypothetical protein|uniref:hypothetical protein n=1 Tax=Pseudomonas TaxID=286 RepID=UPI000C128B9A|nr:MULTISPECIES: hypothetical protein [Pseudomonas]ATP49098.1 hypothetical protein CR512_06850 [Pseudomonas putida]MCX2689214.1 hypothetical protein [Pseudomonas sp. DCB_AW]MDE4539578.1 hypothetical protein [Pseudomonas sp. ITEM 17296]WEL56923.1 hypothetical protein PZ739_07055 [Pseudomonas kermanshahensis]GLO57214.1 hypothetical protein PPUJ20066_32500 [Pseudomonas putida]
MTIAPAALEPADEPQPQDGAALPWADLAAEHFQLLRLAPLPTDRATGARPLRFVQFGYAERHDKAHSLLRMEIQLPGQKVRKEQNHLDIRVDHAERLVRIGSDQGLQLEPLNRGIGRFMLAQAVQWLQRRWSHYRVEGMALPSKDALSEDSRLRRDQFLRGVGIEVEYEDPQHLKGRTVEATVGQLKGAWSSERLQRVEILDAANLLQQADQQLQELEGQLRERDERVAKYRREDGGLRFTITCLVAFAMFQAGLLIWIATR